MKRLFTITLGMWLTIVAVSTVGHGQTFTRIAAWNQQGVEFPNDNEPPVPVHKPAQLRAAIAAINADVIALSEVNSRADMDQIVATPFVNGFRYKMNMDNNQPVPQKIVVLFKDRPDISVTNRRPIPGSDDNQPDRNRKAYAFDVKVRNFDFLLIAVHLKSGRNNPDRNIRSRQASAIAAFIKHEVETKPEKDVLVMGDYNMVPGQDAINFDELSPGPSNNELLRYISDEVPGHPPSHIQRCINQTRFEGNPLDGFAVSAVQTREFTGFIRVLPLHTTLAPPNRGCRNYKRLVSDHLPVVARFRVSGLDDD
jgi:endonuclease/exonuclease/phosphatase family metal-dependent hydrolase